MSCVRLIISVSCHITYLNDHVRIIINAIVVVNYIGSWLYSAAQVIYYQLVMPKGRNSIITLILYTWLIWTRLISILNPKEGADRFKGFSLVMHHIASRLVKSLIDTWIKLLYPWIKYTYYSLFFLPLRSRLYGLWLK